MEHLYKQPRHLHHHGAIIFEKFFFMMMIGGSVFMITCLLIKFFVIDGGVVSGRSMYPTYAEGDLFVIDKTAFLRSAPKRFDIVQVIEDDKLIIKRIIGLPNETITIDGGSVWIGSGDAREKITEPYLSPEITTSIPFQKTARVFKTKDNEYFILGDNRPHSTDSRAYGPIHQSSIIGRIIYRSPK